MKGATLGAGGALLTPMLDRVALANEGRTPGPRFLFVVEGNGLPPEQIHPPGIDFLERDQRERVTVQSLKGLELSESMSPLAAYKDRLAIVQGLSGRMCTGGHSSDHGALGAYHANTGRNIRAATVDAVLGGVNPGIFQNVVLGIASDPNESVIFNCSATGKDKALPTICRPDIAYSRLFGSVAKGDQQAVFTAKRNLMDYMRQDIQRAKARLGGADAQKLDDYLTAYENVSRTTDRLVESREFLSDIAPVAGDKYQSTVESDRLDAHFEMAAAAMIGGVTNAVTIASGVGFPYFNITFTGLGIERGKHPIGHDYRSDRDGQGWKDARRIRRFHFELIARFMKALEAVPEGDGTMLDNTTIVYLSDAAEEHHSRCFEWPMVVIGGCNGRLKTDGRYINYPDYGKPGHRTIGTLYNSLLHAAGVGRDGFGEIDPLIDEQMNQGPLSEFLV
jgi:hypothetical protein